jgi:O-acetyl-ADP-ribose deacetylase (regulator of RNase III)
MAQLEIVAGDITRLAVDAIVNAANPELQGGGGVDGAIHRAAGPELIKASLALGGCAVGDAKATPGFELPSTWIFHAVGPVWSGGSRGEDAALASCYRRCLELATAHDVKTIAFPAISTGVYGFPYERAAEIAVSTVREWADECRVERVIFCCFNRQTAAVYNRLLGRGDD